MVDDKRSHQDLVHALNIQRRAIEKSCAGFDDGETWEAIRLASAVHIIVYDYKRTKSILSQLGVKDSLLFIASGEQINPNNLLSSTPLVMFHMTDGGTEVCPILEMPPTAQFRQLCFRDWWERDPIYRAGNGRPYWFRSKLVTSLRDQDGGTHFDEGLRDKEYLHMKAGAGWTQVLGDKEAPLGGIEFATMRQIAWELCETLDRSGL